MLGAFSFFDPFINVIPVGVWVDDVGVFIFFFKYTLVNIFVTTMKVG